MPTSQGIKLATTIRDLISESGVDNDEIVTLLSAALTMHLTAMPEEHRVPVLSRLIKHATMSAEEITREAIASLRGK